MKNIKSKFAIILSLFFIFSCDSNSSNRTIEHPLTEEELKAQLYQTECSDATKYLSGKLSMEPIYKNTFSMKVNGIRLKCNIINKATLATFKNIKARIEFISKTGATITEKEFDVYELIGPNSSLEYKGEIEITNQQYKDIANYKWSMIQASCN